ncbi:MAG: SUMF1/EgtB/PvdO family nonheme iron enzyme [Flavobacteriales bacterium]|nr:SUMF1/EgtB/PvdO family nonheme iron enzyme [Flavobacteriales bacterium]
MKTLKLFSFFSLIGLLTSCGLEQSSSTGWNYNDQKNGGFQKMPFEEQETGPNLVLIEGGTFTMGRVEQDVSYEWNNYPKRASVSSFYMDETEVTNNFWLEYLYWLKRVYGFDYPEVVTKALPDTLVWRSKLAYNEPYVDYYLRHPAYRDYPVVGVTWRQASDFCLWRTDRVNEHIMVREGILEHYLDQVGEDNFNTDAYLAGQYESGKKIEGLPDFSPNGTGYRRVRMEDGILLPKYRLPTEAEWEYAAYGLIGNSLGERIIEKRIWPWNGHAVRNPEEKYIGSMMANFKRGRGDNMGIAGKLNDNADVTNPVYAYWPNDYGLYNMAGNVSEWVMDIYRPLSSEDNDDFRPFRGNVFEKLLVDEEGFIAEKDSLGRLQKVAVTEEENLDRRNYQRSDNINFLDGDYESHIDQSHWKEFENTDEKLTETTYMYEYGKKSLIQDDTRVYKGGSWRDRAYYMNPGTRRALEETQRTSYIGFRCAMDRVGSPTGLGGN